MLIKYMINDDNALKNNLSLKGGISIPCISFLICSCE